jgi:hypothetical protein
MAESTSRPADEVRPVLDLARARDRNLKTAKAFGLDPLPITLLARTDEVIE